VTDKLTIEEQEERRLAQIENEAQRHDAKAFRDFEFMGIKDEYFDDTYTRETEFKHGTETKDTKLQKAD
jgi:hypothetical protein